MSVDTVRDTSGLPSYIYSATVTTVSTLALPAGVQGATSVIVYQIVIANVDTSDVTLTITNNASSPVTMYNKPITAGDSFAVVYPQGREFANGIKVSASANNAINIEILGRRRTSG